MNVIKTLIARIEEVRTTNKNPCKNYSTEARAEKATAAVAELAARHFTKQGFEVKPAQYVVFFVPEWNRWVGAVSLTELMGRSSSTGGYLGCCGDVFTY
jgi:hypothetical protein